MKTMEDRIHIRKRLELVALAPLLGLLAAAAAGAAEVKESPPSKATDRTPLAGLFLGPDSEVQITTVELEDGGVGLEVVERAAGDAPNGPSTVRDLGVGLGELVNAVTLPDVEVSGPLAEHLGEHQLGPQGWLRPALDEPGWTSSDRRLLGVLELENGNEITFLAVQLEGGEEGIEMMEHGLPGNPSLTSVAELGNNGAEVFNALSSPGTDIPEALVRHFGEPRLGSQGWLRTQWRDSPPDTFRASCNDTTFRNFLDDARTVSGGFFEHLTYRPNWRGTYWHQITRGGAGGNGITDYFSTACNQHTRDYQYRIRRKNTSGSSYVDWTIHFFDPGEWYVYLWSAPSGLYRFRTEINNGYGSAGHTDIGVMWSDL